MFAHSGILCLGFKQFIVGGVLIGLIFPVWGLIELILQNNKKYFTAKQELSDDKRIKLYYEKLLEESKSKNDDNNDTTNNIDKENIAK